MFEELGLNGSVADDLGGDFPQMEPALVDSVVDQILFLFPGKVEVFVDELRDWSVVIDIGVDE